MQHKKTLGFKGEQYARQFLQKKQYDILDENWVHDRAEIDLIAYYKNELIFIEVKTRSKKLFGNPEDFVDEVKEQNIIRAAEAYIELVDFKGSIRFDIIAIIFNHNKVIEIKHIEDAFF